MLQTPIDSYIPTQRNMQLELAKQNTYYTETRIKRNKFTSEEDDRLRQLVTKYGEFNWDQIANEMPNRNKRQCHDRWSYYLNPKIKNEPFTKEEDELLFKLVSQFGGMWVQISKYFNNRSDKQIKNRWNMLKKSFESLKTNSVDLEQNIPNSRLSLSKDIKTIQTANMILNVNQASSFKNKIKTNKTNTQTPAILAQQIPALLQHSPPRQVNESPPIVASIPPKLISSSQNSIHPIQNKSIIQSKPPQQLCSPQDIVTYVASARTNELFTKMHKTEKWYNYFQPDEGLDFDLDETLTSLFD